MNRRPFYIVDVFAEERYAGNQLAVVRGDGHLRGTEMQKIALEMNYSETTFIVSEEERDGGYDVRIFTPKEEIPFAGHPTLGTAYVIQHEVLTRPVERLALNLKAGRILVTFGEVLGMEQLPPTFGRMLESGRLARALSIGEDDLYEGYPIQEVSTGVPFVMVPLKGLDPLKRCKVNRDAYYELVESEGVKSILVFAFEAHEEGNDLAARMFAGRASSACSTGAGGAADRRRNVPPSAGRGSEPCPAHQDDVQGSARFASGLGRHGDFGTIGSRGG